MTQTELFAEAQYLGPSQEEEPEIIIEPLSDGPSFVQAKAIPVPDQAPTGPVTSTYTVPAPPDMYQLKRKRKRKSVRNGLIGGAVGLIVCGPFGAIVGGFGTAGVTKLIHKKKEKRIWKAYQREVNQQAAVAVSMQIHKPPSRRIV